jgi:hypothetical protein
MNTVASTNMLPFELGSPRSFSGLTLVPLFPSRPPVLEYLGLDEAAARGFRVSEIGDEGVVEWLLVENSLPEVVLLYDGEELVGAKQNRIVEQTILVGAGSSLKIPAKCVERGRWARRSQHFAPAPRAAYPESCSITIGISERTTQAELQNRPCAAVRGGPARSHGNSGCQSVF